MKEKVLTIGGQRSTASLCARPYKGFVRLDRGDERVVRWTIKKLRCPLNTSNQVTQRCRCSGTWARDSRERREEEEDAENVWRERAR